MKNNLEKLIVEYLIKEKCSTSIDIAMKFLKFKSPNEKMADIPVVAVMKGIEGVCKNENGFWSYDSTLIKKTEALLESNKWNVVTLSVSHDNKVICIAVSTLKNEKVCEVFWLKNPDDIPEEIQVMLRSGSDKAFLSTLDSVEKVYKMIKSGVLITKSYKELGLLNKVLNYFSYSLPDETFLLSNFLKVAGIKNRNVDELYKSFYNDGITCYTASEINKTFNLVIKKIFNKLNELKIKSIDDFIKFEKDKELLVEWKFLKTKISDIIQVEKKPGVYGFTDKAGKFLYIGKAKNLQKRLLSYFRISDESPNKLTQIRENAFDLIINKCGSELESLLNEQRLIIKHAPTLNKKIGVNERKGEFKYLENSVLILPHINKDKIVTFWIRKDQKIRMVSLGRDYLKEELEAQLDTFFFGDKLKAEETDFQELEIVNRWISQNRDNLNIIYCNRFINGGELRNQIYIEYESYINCMKEY